MHYYSNGRRIPVTRLRSARVKPVSEALERVSVSGWRAIPLATKNYELLVSDYALPERSVTAPRIENLVGDLIQADRELAARDLRTSDDELAFREELGESTAPVLLTEGRGLLLPTGEVVAQFPAGTDAAAVAAAVQARGGALVRAVDFLPDTYLLRPIGGGDGLDLASALVEDRLVTYASPNFIEEMPPRLVAPRNALFGQQWHLDNSGQNGARASADVRALEAWAITTGSPEIIICVIDSGVDTQHPAFTAPGKLAPGFDFEDEDPLADPTTSSHGTSCAGVAAAPWGTAQTVGIAPGCRIMPIRRATLSEHLKMAQAFAWAASNGADVITCSFGYDHRPWVLPDVVRSAIDQATSTGRNGRGTSIIWAAGNGNEPVATDEWASYPGVIAVGASTDQDVRAWYSDYGPAVHVCAPSSGGVNGITTTSNGGYTHAFGGTSSAAPLVAGVVALMLSIDPFLTAQEVRALLTKATDRIDTQSGGYDDTGHSDSYGFGRINAAKALGSIDVLFETVRETNVEQRLPLVRQFATRYLEPRASARPLLHLLHDARFRILRLLVTDASFRANCATVVEAIADAFNSLERDADLTVSHQTWSAITAVIGRFQQTERALAEPGTNGKGAPMVQSAQTHSAAQHPTSSAEDRSIIGAGLTLGGVITWIAEQLVKDPEFLEKLQQQTSSEDRSEATSQDLDDVLARVTSAVTSGAIERSATSTHPQSLGPFEQFAEVVVAGIFRALDARTERSAERGPSSFKVKDAVITVGIVVEPKTRDETVGDIHA